MNFGALRVLNDDIIQGGTGFGKHPHNNMEIITIPLSGSLMHKDNMGDEWIELKPGEVQVMSAGSGLMHAEKNGSSTDFLNLFQIWIFPDKENVAPGYGQKFFDPNQRNNKLQWLVDAKSRENEQKNLLYIHQNARISRIDLDMGNEFSYETLSENHGVYVMLIDGSIEIEGNKLSRRDALGIVDTKDFKIRSIENSEILLIEVPMEF